MNTKLYLLFLFLTMFLSTSFSQITNLSQNSSDCINPKIFYQNENILVFWNDDIDGYFKTYLKFKTGDTWSGIQCFDFLNDSYLISDLCGINDSLYLVWRKTIGNSNSLVLGKFEDLSFVDSTELIHKDSTFFESADIFYESENKSLNICWNEIKNDSSKIYYIYKDSNNVWSSPEMIHSQFGSLDKIKIKIDKFSKIFCFWNEQDSAKIEYKYKSFSDWSSVESIPLDEMYILFDYDAEIDDSLNIHIAIHEHSVLTFYNEIIYTKWDGYNWSPQEFILFQEGCNTPLREHKKPQIAFSSDQKIVVTCEQYDYNYDFSLIKTCISSSIKLNTGWHKNRNISDYRVPKSPHITIDNDDIIHYVWRDTTDGDYDIYYKTADLISGISDEKNPILSSFNVSQNYPNPFNPSTTITYNIPIPENVEFMVYNVFGQQVFSENLGNKQKGIHHYKFTAKNLSTGIYIYQIKAGHFMASKKCLLVK